MKNSSMSTAAALMAVIGLALSVPATASESTVHPAMAHYIQNATTPEDHEAIAAHFDVEAAKAHSLIDSFDVQDCEHSQMMELQRSGRRFAGVIARRHCRKLLRGYVEREQQNRALADYHKRVAASWHTSMD